MNSRKNKNKTVRILPIAALMLLLVAIPFVLYTLFHATAARAEWFNASWGYRQAVRFTNGGSAVTDQKVLIAVDTATQITANKMQSSCQDVRFTDATGKLLQYYINVSGGAGVGCNDASSDFYVLMPSIVAGDNLIYIYYGNPSALAGTASANFGNTTFSPSVGPTAATQETTPGPVAYWKLDDGQGSTASDSSGHGNSLTLTSTAWATQSATLSNRTQYLQFNGATSLASRANDVEFDFGTGSFSISAWIRHSSNITGTDVLITKYNTQGWKVYMNSSGYICFGIDDDNSFGPDDSACTTTSYADSQWHHIEVVKQGTTSITVYVDGIQKAQTTSLTATATLSTSATLYIGADSAGNTNWWDGWVDDVAIYPYARTIAQVQADATGIQSGTSIGASTKDPLTDGLVGWWKMDENTGTTAADHSGNQNTGTFTNSPTWALGKFGSGVQYSDGTTNKYISVSPSSSIDNLTSLTYATWVRFSTMTDDVGLFGKTGVIQFWINEQSSGQFRPYFSVNHTGDNLSIPLTSSSNLSAGVWYHLAVAWDGGTSVSSTRIYINGIEQERNANSTAATGSKDSDSGSVLLIGNRASGIYQVNGTMDEARVYNRALSSSEIRQLYSWSPGPIAHFKMDENTGTSTTNDSSGVGGTATLNEFASGAGWGKGKIGSGISITGTDPWVDFYSSNLASQFSGDQGTVGVWLKVLNNATLTDGLTHQALKMGVDVNNTINIQKTTTNNVYYLQYVASGTSMESFLTISTTDWFHLSIVWDKPGNTVKYYQNGILVETDTGLGVWSGALASTRATFGNNYNGTSAWNGSIDDFKLYNYPRTSSQIVEDMSARGGSAIGGNGGPVINWKFDELQGASAGNVGYGGSGYAGTISGATWYPGGKIGGALATTTSTNFVSAGDQAFVDNLTGFTTGFWVKPISLATNKALVSKSNFSTQNSFAVVTDNSASDEVRIHIPTSVSDTGTYFLTSNLNLANDTWSYMSVIYNASESASTRVRVYKDGKEISGSVTGTLPDKMTTGTTSLLKVGASDSGSYTALNAVFDEVKIYPYPLTYDQMLIDYNGKAALQLGSLSTHSDGTTASNSATREFCVPGDTTSCAPPVGWWKMDENTGTSASDASGNGGSGSLGNGTAANMPVWARGKSGSGLNFDGTNDYVTVASNSRYIMSGDFTVQVWVKFDTLPSAKGTSESIVCRHVSLAPYEEYCLYGNSVNDRILFTNTNTAFGGGTATTNYSISANTWYHVVGVKSGTNMKIYINGSTTNTTDGTFSGTLASTAGDLYIGSYDSNQGYTDGVIDDVRIYNYARSSAQVAWDYNRGGPLAHYKFDECQGATASNVAPNANGSAAGMNATITIGATGTYTSLGTCGSGTSTESWNGGTTGKYGSALAIDATNDYAVVPDTSALDFTTEMTVSGWINSSVLPTTSLKDANIVNKYITGTNQRSYKLIVDKADNKYYFLVDGDGASGATASVASDVTFTTGVWHHVAGVFKDSTAYIYVDGMLQSSTSTQGFSTIYAGTADLVIGMDANKTSAPNTGLYDDVMLFNYALTAQQIKMLYNQKSAVRFGQ